MAHACIHAGMHTDMHVGVLAHAQGDHCLGYDLTTINFADGDVTGHKNLQMPDVVAHSRACARERARERVHVCTYAGEHTHTNIGGAAKSWLGESQQSTD